MDFDQYTVNYAVRNITTGDEEDLRLVEDAEHFVAGFPAALRDEARRLITEAGALGTPAWQSGVWQRNQDRLLELLLPYISDRALYDADYEAWERALLDDDDDDA